MAERKICSIDGCEKPATAKGFCSGHYHKKLRYVDPHHSIKDRSNTGKPCKVEGCDSPHSCKGFCKVHYARWSRYGVTENVGRTSHRLRWLEENKSYDGAECLIWPFAISGVTREYVKFRGKIITSARAMCILAHGDPSNSFLQAAHSCGNGHLGCVNPKHLRWATPAENAADKIKHGTLIRGEDIAGSLLNRTQVLEIRKSPRPVKELAAAYGVTISAIYSIRQRRVWAWLED